MCTDKPLVVVNGCYRAHFTISEWVQEDLRAVLVPVREKNDRLQLEWPERPIWALR
jgi:hypothetical protein